MDDHIIRINGYGWKMTIDLKELAGSAGIRKNLVKADGHTYDEKVVSVPMARARRLLQLIRQYGTGKDFERCDEYLMANTRLYKHWRELCER